MNRPRQDLSPATLVKIQKTKEFIKKNSCDSTNKQVAEKNEIRLSKNIDSEDPYQIRTPKAKIGKQKNGFSSVQLFDQENAITIERSLLTHNLGP